ncbi:NAD(P)-dependent oxidoreductase [Polynucleobacter sphagniphilus]|uniref:NAD(P)-dependent oxidoreductase n=1 Tax=Polynucleobacter sphagniphilus TaxID=1743169 RepID=UPI00096BC9D3|nr:NAD(P)-dependent oxidoreductase [Polynucleobacter sphagniphilus]OLY97123.1 pyridine nucleotide transhydrogenase [Polynucleobacter sphagniphilus]
MNNALIGFSGFVGGTLLKQASFSALYRSSNINEIEDLEFDIVICAGAPAQKWIANKNPAEDLQKINDLISHLKTVKCSTFILISTIDVFKHPVEVDEKSSVEESGLHAYGLHRRLLEKFVEEQFPNYLIVRLPGLVGPRLRKNVIFDFLNENNLDAIESRGIFQFYPMVNLWSDIQAAIGAGLKLIHLTAEPISVSEVANKGFGRIFENHISNAPARYDMRTCYASIFGASGLYQYSARETIQAVRAYAQSELPKNILESSK